jgi:two-component system sensor histidine kinase MtrB
MSTGADKAGQAARRLAGKASKLVRRAGHAWGTRWRRSLQLRVVVTTMVFSVVVVGALMLVLHNQVASGLIDAKTKAATAEASAGFNDAKLQAAQADVTTKAELASFIDDLVFAATSKGGPVGLYEVVLLSSPVVAIDLAPPEERASGQVDPRSVPQALRDQVRRSGRVQSTFVEISYLDGRPASPGYAVGVALAVPALPDAPSSYEMYYLFPLTQEQDTVRLVRQVFAGAGLVLVVLLAGIAWIVTKQVVDPVRMAARIAERFSAGRLEERMRVRGEDDLARLAASFNHMAAGLQRQIRQLEDLSRVQRRFVSDVSHELRTPLTTVRMAADVLHESRETFDPAVRRSAELLQAQLDRFEALLADLLEISRFDAGAAHLDAEMTDLREVARRVIDAAEPLAERRGATIALTVPDTPCVAEMDTRRIERVLRNLVVNAIEHGDGCGVVVRVAADEHAVAVAVRDHGVGLRPGESALVFNRFWRADPARARRSGGTGLGLSIALEDAHLHGGWLQAWGALGDGSQFRLTLPKQVGGDIDGSPIPLEPGDSLRRLGSLTPEEPKPTGPPADSAAGVSHG